eukprot:3244044-Rhodomonas_salina.1
MQCPVLTSRMLLYQSAATRPASHIQSAQGVVPGRDPGTKQRLSPYAHPTRCPVLTKRAARPGEGRDRGDGGRDQG